jgi:xanthine dehydrogenase accessory factor
VVVPSLEGVSLAPGTDAVHTDHDAPGIAGQLATLLGSGARFVGVMGSARHTAPHLDALRAQGIPEEDLARLRTPVGLDLGARTPAEIALSILAGLLAARTGRTGGWLDRR